jgi:glycosyltransferase involved in cell wall biosynthesis
VEIEIILINDCSPDNCQSIIEEYAEKDKRIILIKHEVNQGVSVARNNGIDIAKGEYIGFVDSDDYIDLDFYEKLYEEVKSNEYPDIVKGNVKITDFNGKTKIKKNNKKIRKNKFHFTWQFWSAIYKRSFIQKNKINFSIDIIVIQDLVFLVKNVILTDKIIAIDNTFYNHIRVENSLDSTVLSENKIKSNIDAVKLIIDIINSNTISKENYLFIFSDYLYYLKEMFNRGLATDKKSKQLVTNALVELYSICKYKKDFLYYNRSKKWYKFLVNGNADKLYDFIDSSNNIHIIKLFKIPIIKIIKNDCKTQIKLFNIIPLLKIKEKYINTEYYLFDFIKIISLETFKK